MKKQLFASIALMSFLITLSWSAHAQLFDPCAFVPLDELAQCLAGNGGGGSPQVPNQPPVTYALGTTGDVYISTNERVFEGISSKIHLVKSGSSQVEVIKTFPLGTRVTVLKVTGDKLYYLLQNGNGYASISIKYLQKDSLGNYIERSLFEELTGENQGQLILSYKYSEFTVLNGFAYVKKTTYTYAHQEPVCVPGFGCLEDTEPPVFVSAIDIIYKQGITSPTFEVVSSMPGTPAPSSQYSFSIIRDNIYRTDAETGQTILWLQNNNQAGHNLQIVGISEGYLLFRSTSGYNDMTTNLIAVKITDDIPNPELRLATDLSGVVFVAYQVEASEKKISLRVSLYNKSNIKVNSDLHELRPSWFACGLVTAKLEKRKFILECMEEENISGQIVKTPIEDCQVRISLSSNGANGGHNEATHIFNTDRWGIINVPKESFVLIPEMGLEIIYETPEASGEALIEFELMTPKGQILSQKEETVFRIKSDATLVPLSITGLDTSTDIKSHSGNGHYVTQPMHDKLATAIANFRIAVKKEYGPAFQVPTLRTGGASLIWGGLFDVHRNWSSIIPVPADKKNEGHCTHRYGVQIDLSMGVFNDTTYSFNEETKKQLKTILDKKIQDAKLVYPVEKESPSDTKHWHIQYEN